MGTTHTLTYQKWKSMLCIILKQLKDKKNKINFMDYGAGGAGDYVRLYHDGTNGVIDSASWP